MGHEYIPGVRDTMQRRIVGHKVTRNGDGLNIHGMAFGLLASWLAGPGIGRRSGLLMDKVAALGYGFLCEIVIKLFYPM